MEWCKITVSSDPAAEEIVSGVLLDLGAQGVAVNGGPPPGPEDTGAWDYTEGLPEPEEYSVEAYYGLEQGERIAGEIARRLEAALGAPVPVASEVVDDAAWLNAWKDYFKPVRAADRIVVKPTWCEYHAYPDDVIVEIDPGMAFGTGGHETTRMSLKFIEQYLYSGDTVVDVGSGSGVLAIAAAKLGAETVYALEQDPTAVRVAQENVIGNETNEQVTVIESDLLTALPEGVQADLIVSNIIADVIVRLVPTIGESLRPNGMFVCSGIIDSRLHEVLHTLVQNGLRIIAVERDGEWCAVAAKNKG